MSMNNLSRRTVLLMLAYLLTAVTLTLIIIWRSSEEKKPTRPVHNETSMPSQKDHAGEVYSLEGNA